VSRSHPCPAVRTAAPVYRLVPWFTGAAEHHASINPCLRQGPLACWLAWHRRPKHSTQSSTRQKQHYKVHARGRGDGADTLSTSQFMYRGRRCLCSLPACSDRHSQAEFKDLKEQYSGRIHLKRRRQVPQRPLPHHRSPTRSFPHSRSCALLDVSSSRSASP
jgi:hypothetical protein